MPCKKYKAGQLITITTPIRRVLRIKRKTSAVCISCDKCCIDEYLDSFITTGNKDRADELLNEICLGLCQKLPANLYFATCYSIFKPFWEIK